MNGNRGTSPKQVVQSVHRLWGGTFPLARYVCRVTVGANEQCDADRLRWIFYFKHDLHNNNNNNSKYTNIMTII